MKTRFRLDETSLISESTYRRRYAFLKIQNTRLLLLAVEPLAREQLNGFETLRKVRSH